MLVALIYIAVKRTDMMKREKIEAKINKDIQSG